MTSEPIVDCGFVSPAFGNFNIMSKEFIIKGTANVAESLYTKFEKIFVDANADSWGKEAKQCVDIVFHEIIQELEDRKQHINDLDVDIMNRGIDYWDEIRKINAARQV